MKRIVALLLALFVFMSCAISVTASESNITAPDNENTQISFPKTNSLGVSLYNIETGITVFSKNGDTRMYPASTTKIMTAIVTLEKCPDPKNTFITVKDASVFKYIIDDGGVEMGIKTGETFSVYDLLAAVMLNSCCDASELLAYHFGGGEVSRFVELMNEKAAELGCQNTQFENAHGLHNKNHYSTPNDMSQIMAYAVKNPTFREIISLREYTIPATELTVARELNFTVSIYFNNDKYEQYYLDAYVGGKSGFTDEAGRCLCTYAEQDGMSLVLTLFGAGLNSKDTSGINNPTYRDTYATLLYAYSNLETSLAFPKGATVKEIPVLKTKVSVNAVATDDIYLLSQKGKTPEYNLDVIENLSAKEVQNGLECGSLTALSNGAKSRFTHPLVISYNGKRIVERFTVVKYIGLTLLSLFVLILIIRFINGIKRKRRRKRRIY